MQSFGVVFVRLNDMLSKKLTCRWFRVAWRRWYAAVIMVMDRDVSTMKLNNTKERRRIIKNLLVLSTSSTLYMIVYMTLITLKSSINLEDGLGVTTLAINYTVAILTSLFVPKWIIRKIGHKWTMVLAVAAFMPWVAANGHAVWATLVPTSLIVGTASIPLLTAQSSYVSLIGNEYAKLTNSCTDDVVARFMGVFYFFMQLGESKSF